MAKVFASAQEAFGYLLDTFEAQPDRKAGILAAPDYQRMDAAQEGAFLEATRLATACGAVSLEMCRRPDEHLIKYVRLVSSDALYAYMSRTPRGDLAEAGWGEVLQGLKRNPEWLEGERRMAIKAWGEHRTWRGLDMSQTRQARAAIALAAALEEGVKPGTYYQTFSAEHAGDSKALRRCEMVVSGILRESQGLPPAGPSEEPLAVFGISVYPDPVLLRGPFLAGTPPVSLQSSQVYAAVTPPNIATVAWSSDAPYVLTIENKASFNAYVHGVVDPGAVVFTGGFPSGCCIALLQKLAADAPSTPWFHWGDIDSGGVRIFEFLEREVCRPAGVELRPHLMEPSLAERHGQVPGRRGTGLRRIADSDSAIAPLAQYLLSPGSFTLEQEVIRPRSPIEI